MENLRGAPRPRRARAAAEHPADARGLRLSGPLGWRADGRELYYADQAMGVLAVRSRRGAIPPTGTPVKLFTLPVVIGSGYLPPVTGDGRRFIVSEMPFAAGQPIRLLTNWTARLDSAR